MEIIRPNPAPGRLRQAVFDFDGTLSLIRAGWPEVMAGLMLEVLRAAPPAAGETEAQLRAQLAQPIYGLAGRPTILQMQWLADEVGRRGSAPLSAEAYKREYIVRLRHSAGGLAALQAGTVPAARLRVPGALEFVERLRAGGVTCYIASGTDEAAVREEAAALGLAPFMADIRGARDDVPEAKRALIERVSAEHRLGPGELAVFGDGSAEIEYARAVGALAIGLASDEAAPGGLDERKRLLLLAAGADAIIPDFSQPAPLLSYLWPAE